MMRMLWLAMLLLGTATAQAAGLEGAAERYGFTPGDRVLYRTELAKCPVGEMLPDWRAVKGDYECARFRDRIWMRPLAMGTVLLLPFDQPLPAEFSLEFDYYTHEEGCPFVEFRLHSETQLARFGEDSLAYAGGAYAGGHLACPREPSSFGAANRPGRLRLDLQTRVQGNGPHRVAVQARRGQIRFFLDGKRIGRKHFDPEGPIAGLSLYFYRHYGTGKDYAEVPVLIGDLRLAAYSAPEAVPQAERDLIRELGAVTTPEGLKVTLSAAVLFDFGKWTLRPQAGATLDKLARLAALRKGRIRIEGHTDNVGSEQFNLVLSELRAHVVALALARRGVDARRLVPRGFGESRPVAPNDTEAGRARNRRVEIYLENG